MNLSSELYEYLKDTFEVISNDGNPLKELPESQKELFFINNGLSLRAFNTREDLNMWLLSNKPKFCIKSTVKYLGDVAGKSDVLKEERDDGVTRLIRELKPGWYEVYNIEKSSYKGDFVWDSYLGDLRVIFESFKKDMKQPEKQKVKMI